MELPNRLRLRDGELVLDDGGDVREYLRAFATRGKVTPDTPLTIRVRSQDQADVNDAERWRYWGADRYALAA